MDDADDELTRLAIRQAFEAEDQYHEIVAVAEADRIIQLRAAGRKIAGELGWKVRTAVVPIDDEQVMVVMVITQSTLLRDQAMRARRQQKIRTAMHNMSSRALEP